MKSSGGNFDSSFDAEKGVGTIVIAKPLDAEQRSVYNMSVEVTDGTNVAVTQVSCWVTDSKNVKRSAKERNGSNEKEIQGVINYAHGCLVFRELFGEQLGQKGLAVTL